jgi:hypothetical protein
LAVGDRIFIRLLESVEAHVNGPLDAWPIGQLQHELLKLIV